MSESLTRSDYFQKVRLNIKTKIKSFIVFDDSKGFNVLFTTREDNVYGFGSNFYGSLGLTTKSQVKNPTKVLDLCQQNINQFITGTSFVLAFNGKHDIYSWGKNDMGQLGRGYVSNQDDFLKPEKMPKFTDKLVTHLSCGSYYALALTSDGTVFGWGCNTKGQTGCGDTDKQIVSTPVVLHKLIDISINSIHCCFDQSYALTNNGQVYSWGWNTCCQLGLNVDLDQSVYEPMLIEINNVKIVCPAFRNTYFLTNDNLLYFCGIFIDNNKENKKPFQLLPKQMQTELRFDSINTCLVNQDIFVTTTALIGDILFALNFDRIFKTKYYNSFDFYANEEHMTAETIDTDLMAPELRLSVEELLFTHITGQLAKNPEPLVNDVKNEENIIKTENIFQNFYVFDEITPQFLLNIRLFHVFDDWMGLNVLFITTDDNVFGFGSNSNGVLGLGHNRVVKDPQLIDELCFKNIKQFYNALNFAFALTDENQLLGWGWNMAGQLGRGYISKIQEYLKPDKISVKFNGEIIDVKCGANHTLVLTSSGVVYGWGNNKGGEVGCGDESKEYVSEPIILNAFINETIKSIHCSFAVTTEGLVYSWGHNQWCKLGHDIAEDENIFTPTLINISNIVSVCHSSANTYFLSSDGNIYFCGLYENQENCESFQFIPKLIETDIRFQSIQSIHYFRKQISIATAMSENTIHLLDLNKTKTTKHNNYLSYYSFVSQMTYQSICLNDSDLERLAVLLNNIRVNTKSTINTTTEEVYTKEDNLDKQIDSNVQKQSLGYKVLGGENCEYEILDRIGSGAFGTVFKVRNITKNEVFAIKSIKFKSSDKERVMREVHTISKLRGDCIIRYFSSSIEDNCLYIQMEFCDESLKNIIKVKGNAFNRTCNQSLNIFEYFICCQLFAELLQCIQYLHEIMPQLIHRDLKPENILIKYNNNGKYLKICDFGLSTVHSFEDMKHTSKLGTERYVAPEVAVGRGYNNKADIYSTGIIALDLFDIDINNESKHNFNNDLKCFYENLKNQIILMLNTNNYRKRPESSEVLATAEEWCVDPKDVKQRPDFESTITRLKGFDNIFFYKYIFDKLSL